MKNKHEQLVKQLTEHYVAHDTTQFGIFDFLFAFGSPLEAATYARLFWPDFLVLDEMVFLASVIEDDSDVERVRNALANSGMDRPTIEKSFNSLEIPSGIFGRRAEESSDFI
jgi:hypothetical protein